jgi:hypothetical protein
MDRAHVDKTTDDDWRNSDVHRPATKGTDAVGQCKDRAMILLLRTTPPLGFVWAAAGS